MTDVTETKMTRFRKEIDLVCESHVKEVVKFASLGWHDLRENAWSEMKLWNFALLSSCRGEKKFSSEWIEETNLFESTQQSKLEKGREIYAILLKINECWIAFMMADISSRIYLKINWK